MQKPTILKEGNYSQQDLAALKNGKIWKVVDIRESQLRELYEIDNANLISHVDFDAKVHSYLQTQMGPESELRGDYIYYPWSGVLLHAVGQADMTRLRTNRTNNLITPEEQKKLASFTAGVAGLSFGNGIVLSLIYTGASDSIKIADTDIFETTNLNRVRVGLPSVNRPKTAVTTEEIYEINPYANVFTFEDGLTEENINDFINGSTKLNIVFDVVDDFSMKVRLRLAARAARVPVVMLTSLEDSVLVDVERFDINPDAEIFHGLLDGVADDLLNKDMSELDKAQYAMRIVGHERVSYRNLRSLAAVGTELVSRPHLFGTVSIVCGLASYITKRIALGEEMPSMRKHIEFHNILGITSNKDDTQENRDQLLNQLMSRSE